MSTEIFTTQEPRVQAPNLTVATFNSTSLRLKIFKNKIMGMSGQIGSEFLSTFNIKFFNAMNISFFKNDS